MISEREDGECALTADERRILEEYRYTLMEVEAISKQIEWLRIPGDPNGIGAAPMGERTPSTHDKLHASFQQMDGLDAVLKKQKRILERRTVAFENVLASIREPRTRTVLRLYYGLGYSDEMIARSMGISRASVWRVRDVLISERQDETQL